MKTQKKKGGTKKIGRAKRKAQGKQSPVSKYARGVITFEQYLKQTKIRKNSS